jgi:hypothetical protein
MEAIIKNSVVAGEVVVSRVKALFAASGKGVDKFRILLDRFTGILAIFSLPMGFLTPRPGSSDGASHQNTRA